MRASQFHCVINTVLALLGSAFAAFGISSLLENKFNMVHIQVPRLAMREHPRMSLKSRVMTSISSEVLMQICVC